MIGKCGNGHWKTFLLRFFSGCSCEAAAQIVLTDKAGRARDCRQREEGRAGTGGGAGGRRGVSRGAAAASLWRLKGIKWSTRAVAGHGPHVPATARQVMWAWG